SGCFVELGAFKPFQRVSAFSRCSCTTLSRSMLMAGKSLYRDGQFEEAIVVLDELIDRYPTSGYLAEARRVRRLAEEARDGAGGDRRVRTIGIILPIDGDHATLAQGLFTGIRFAIDEHNLIIQTVPIRIV